MPAKHFFEIGLDYLLPMVGARNARVRADQHLSDCAVFSVEFATHEQKLETIGIGVQVGYVKQKWLVPNGRRADGRSRLFVRDRLAPFALPLLADILAKQADYYVKLCRDNNK